MRNLFLSAFFGLILSPLQTIAGPVGTYDVVGTDPGSGNQYHGTVSVIQNGEAYKVDWNVDGVNYVGTGLGAADVNGTPTIGPASDRDTAIAISYVAEGSFGLTFYVEQNNGQWMGIWTHAGSQSIGTEIWTPIN